MDWNNKRVLITGGASFMGSRLFERGPLVKVVVNLIGGELEIPLSQTTLWRKPGDIGTPDI
jgi:nucleoside-diphosphate-sugar epimerase